MTPTDRVRLGLPDLGVGVGLRVPHYEHVFTKHPAVDWFEIISENFMVDGGMPRANLERVLSRYRVAQHGVSMSIGTKDPLDREYLRKLRDLVRRTGTPWVSDHLCWTGVGGVNLHDLCPLPYTEEAVKHVAARARAVQDFLGVRFAIENVSSYLTYTSSAMTEWEFLTAVCEEADCGLLLDVNNIYVSSYNHGFDARAYVDGVPHHRVVQMHLAGHTNKGKYIIDTHSDHVIDPVWELYRRACERCGDVSTLVEWDDDIPPFETLLAEAEKARVIREEVARGRAAGVVASSSAGAAPTIGRGDLGDVMGFLGSAFRRPEPIVDDAVLTEASREHVAGNDRLTPAEQVDIYRRQFWMRHVDSLIEDYPGLVYILGDDGFDAFARAYLEASPSRSWSLRNLGNELAAFAGRYEGFPPERAALARDMARYELAFVDLFDGADVPPLDAARLASIPEEAWDTARVVLHPLLARLAFDYPVHTIRNAVRAGETPELPAAAAPIHLVLFRKELRIHYEEVPAHAFELLDALGRGEPLAVACDAIAARLPEDEAARLAEQIGPWFQRWTSLGWLADVNSSPRGVSRPLAPPE